jgi:hypothetical protein
MKCKCGKEIPVSASSCPNCGRATKGGAGLGLGLRNWRSDIDGQFLLTINRDLN